MRVNGRWLLLCLICAALASSRLTAQAASPPYLEDARTARAVTLRAPRTTLGECLKVLSAATGIQLSAAADLAGEPLVGFLPRRPVRETMSALEGLFDADWSGTGRPAAYRLQRSGARLKAWHAAREKLLAGFRKKLDGQAAEAVKKARMEPLPMLDSGRRELFALLLWNELSAAQKLQVLSGVPVTAAIPAVRAETIHELAMAIASKGPGALVAPMLATLDLDDRSELALPMIRARATGMRENSIVGAIHSIDFIKSEGPPAGKIPEGGPELPAEIGAAGRLEGTRDGMVLQLGEGGEVPILSRQRAQGGSGPAVVAGGRTVPQVAADLAAATDTLLVPNSRGYVLLRSNTELFDAAGQPSEALDRYLAQQIAPGAVVPLPALAELGGLSLFQLAVLERGNVCTVEAGTAREVYTVLHFFLSLTADQRQALFSPAGLPARRLTHAQLHHLLDEKDKRVNWEVHTPLQQMDGLAFRMEQVRGPDGPAITMTCLREGREIEGAVLFGLPRSEPEERPSAAR